MAGGFFCDKLVIQGFQDALLIKNTPAVTGRR